MGDTKTLEEEIDDTQESFTENEALGSCSQYPRVGPRSDCAYRSENNERCLRPMQLIDPVPGKQTADCPGQCE